MTKASATGTDSKKDFWLRLRNYHFEHLAPPHLLDTLRAAFGGADASTQAFADKLTRKLRWNRPFALRAIGEYKKFLYLGVVSDFPVTPPRVIDQVWHEHLLFSRAYREFCDQVLGRTFDHNPELVPIDEQTAAFHAQYAATLDLYRTEFNVEPPVTFWGTPKFAALPGKATPSPERKRRDGGDGQLGHNDTPLYAYFDGSSGDGGPSNTMPEFGGGESGGGGGGGEWGDSGSDGHADADSSGAHGSDGGGSSDSGSSDGGGSGCSSGCGGGGD